MGRLDPPHIGILHTTTDDGNEIQPCPHQTSFEAFIADEVKTYRDICLPIRVPFLTRQLVRHVACAKLHPNPDDEFCDPSIGPNYGIINRYMESFRNAREREHASEYSKEPIIVERIHPDGYMILNGHHRWAAAKRLGYKKIWVKIVNLTQAIDIKRWLERSKNTRRVTLDLDEVVLCANPDMPAERPLSFPLNRFYGAPMRRGIPNLFNFLQSRGYDVWVYTRQLHSVEHVRHYFMCYHIYNVNVITGAGRRTRVARYARKVIDAMIAQKYRTTLSIDNDAVIRTTSGNEAFEEYKTGGGQDWAREVKEIVRKLDSHEA